MSKSRTTESPKKQGLRAVPTLMVIALGCLAATAGAAEPTAGSVLNGQQRNTLPDRPQPGLKMLQIEGIPEPEGGDEKEGPRFWVEGFRITQAIAFSEAELQAQLKGLTQQTLSIKDLNGAAAVITRYYRSRGYFVANAVVPVQEIKDGIVEIKVLEGSLDRLETSSPDANLRLETAVSQSIMRNALHKDGVLRERDVERGLQMINDLPGIYARATLQPGSSLGTTLLMTQIHEGPLLAGDIGLDNYGMEFTGGNRLNAGVNLNDPSGRGDLASLRVTHTSYTDYWRLSYSRPFGHDGLKLGVAASGSTFRLCCEFSALNIRGFSDVATLNASYPLTLEIDRRLYASVAFDAKRLVNNSVAGLTNDSRIHLLTLGLNGNRSQGLGSGSTNYELFLGLGRLNIAAPDYAVVFDQETARTAGDFAKLNYSLGRVQSINGQWSLNATFSGQLSANNLPSSEQFVLGGPSGVRAYPQGEASGDEGMVLNLEVRRTLLPGLSLSVFADHGQIRQHHNPWANWQPVNAPKPNSYRLSGIGTGLSWWGASGTLFAQALVARALDGNPGRDTRGNNADGGSSKTRFWVQLVKYF